MSGRICFVVQRYGLEINGGAEALCRMYAEKLASFYDVEVLTTKAVDYMSWKNEYEADKEEINDVTVLRFPVKKERGDEFHRLNSLFMQGKLPVCDEQKWIDEQGPLCPELVSYLMEHEKEYKAIVFFTYLYYPTVMGIKAVSNRSILMPFAHDEPFLRMKIFDDVFLKPDAMVYSTDEERELIGSRFRNEHIPYVIGGAGVDLPPSVDGERFKKKYGIDNYIVYVGRIDESKGCKELLNFFYDYKERNYTDISLVLMGKTVMDMSQYTGRGIINLGFVSDGDKFDGIAGAKALVLPSRFESLSMVVLEAMSVETPVIVNGACEVLKGHCLKSNGALYYSDYFEFEGELNYLLNPRNAGTVAAMKANAKRYVDENYQWDAIISRVRGMIEKVGHC